MTIKNAERVIKHDQHCTQPLLSQKRGDTPRGDGCISFKFG